MSTIRFKTKPFKIHDWTVLRLPEEASAKLPSRGQVMVKGTIKGYTSQTPLEPDGRWSHWFKVDNSLSKATGLGPGDTVWLCIKS